MLPSWVHNCAGCTSPSQSTMRPMNANSSASKAPMPPVRIDGREQVLAQPLRRRPQEGEEATRRRLGRGVGEGIDEAFEKGEHELTAGDAGAGLENRVRSLPQVQQPLQGSSHRVLDYAGRMLRQATTTVTVATRGRGLVEITSEVAGFIRETGLVSGLATLFVRHTSASLLIQENADPAVLADLDRFFARLVPDGDTLFRHRDEGPDDMPAHVRAALTATQLSIPLIDGRLALGTWQGIYLWEHRTRPHRREVVLHVAGE